MTQANSAEAQVLVINCGSSSIKYQLLAMGPGELVAGGVVERIGETDPVLKRRVRNESGVLVDEMQQVSAADHREAFRVIEHALRTSPGFADGRALIGIGHRVVHGGESFSSPTLITPTVIGSIRALSSLAPLHNPPNLIGIKLCREHFAQVPQVAVFDTAFHQTMPPRAYRYAVPEDWYERDGVRRYGFHGSSHRYVATRAADYLGLPLTELRMITLHLGNGASAAAIDRGRCIDTSMGFTPLEGLVMGTRCGDLDPAVCFYMQKVRAMEAEGIEAILNRESGLKGLCGSNDMREVLARAETGDEEAALAVEIYCYRIKKYIGAYAAALGGFDVLVFTGGVGENSPAVRRDVCQGLDVFGIALDADGNAGPVAEVLPIGRGGLPVSVLVVRTNEELQIARDALVAIRAV
jgi:acetate kinase